MSTISTVAGTILCGLAISVNLIMRSSGTVITPMFGSIVQKGKLAACALALLRQLKRVDLPTFGKPTIPHCNDIFYFRLTVGNLPNVLDYFHRQIPGSGF